MIVPLILDWIIVVKQYCYSLQPSCVTSSHPLSPSPSLFLAVLSLLDFFHHPLVSPNSHCAFRICVLV